MDQMRFIPFFNTELTGKKKITRHQLELNLKEGIFCPGMGHSMVETEGIETEHA